MSQRLGVMCGGGESAGENPCIATIYKVCRDLGIEVVGIRYGWEGLIDSQTVKLAKPLTFDETDHIDLLGGTILGTSRTNPYNTEDGVNRVKENMRRLRLPALITIGGDDTNGAALRLHRDIGLRCVNIPQTMDGDIGETDRSLGEDSAIDMATKMAMAQLSAMRANRRVGTFEVYGRDAGWVALNSAIASRTTGVLIPEVCRDMTSLMRELALICEKIQRDGFGLVIVSEGVANALPKKKSSKKQKEEVDQFGHPRHADRGIGNWVANEIHRLTGKETKSVVQPLHIVRASPPTTFDVLLGKQFGLMAAKLAFDGSFGMMVALRGNEIIAVPTEEALASPKLVPLALYESYRPFFS